MATGYVNPIGPGLSGERIDMGVDYGGVGNLYALGSGTITSVSNSGWPGGTFICIKLDSGNYIYYAEDITPEVRVGQRVTAGQLIGHATGGPDGIEVGWAAPPGTGQTMADKSGQDKAGLAAGDPGKYPTAYGVSMSNLIKSLGGPAGTIDGAIQGTVPAGFTGTSGAIATSGAAPGQATLQDQAAAAVGALTGGALSFLIIGLFVAFGGFMLYKVVVRT